ncbi:receptor-like protein kinase 7 [Punica granatum]|uniref:non-specific serine/threonine protein kinase n=1 Tax=Punica granatum TaxID=22663 RepID=A0A6P8EGZ6_PUNGR|nr:receptor-like protein kinase 7 [Punica granatum]
MNFLRRKSPTRQLLPSIPPTAMSAEDSCRRNRAPLPLLLCLLCLFLPFSSADELAILLNLTATLQSPDSSVFASWAPDKPLCSFAGVTCNSNGSVHELNLSSKQLSGELPLDSICELKLLEKLAFGFNSLHGTLSGGLNNCARLRYLDLGNNRFTGPFPDISSLVELRYLYLNSSGFSGSFPWNSLKGMTNLISLSIGDNPFDSSPFPEQILGLRELNWLYMSNCSIGGEIPPAIGGLTKLIDLELSDNNITGRLPREIGNLINLWQLELYNNSLTGKLPVGLRNLTKLQNFDASMNYLEGDLSELRFLNNLVSLQLFMNGFSGEVPTEFGEFRKLVNLSLYTNKLTGPLPAKLGSWAKFDFIDVSDNLLTGPIPPDMCEQGTMTELLMLQNKFTGEIPETYGNCPTLTRFRVSNNSLSGSVPPGIWGLPALNIIDVTMNQLEGPVTADIENARSLGQLFISNNRFSGQLPKEISKAGSLVTIDLSNNQFSGDIPSTIGELKNLGSLHLENNQFSGSIPESLGSCGSLSEVNMAQNLLNGKIPLSLGSLPVMNSLNLSDNKLSGRIPSTLSSLRLSLLDLSNNRLTGQIPQSLSIEAYNGSFSGNPGLCSAAISSFSRCPSSTRMPKDIQTLVVCLIVGIVFLLMLLGIFLYKHRRDEKHEDYSLKDESWDVKSFRVLSFTEDEILDSIKQENLIGKGASGNVYKVVLVNGKELAVKHIWNAGPGSGRPRKGRGTTAPMLGRANKSKEFESEVQTLSSIRHVNVVKLYCSITSDDSSLLVYEYLPNGSLWDKLHTGGKTELDWHARYEVALGAAKGLEYLHHGYERPVIHRDVKSSNILLDEFLKPRIADFGLAKIVQTDSTKDSTKLIAGTHGYIAPEYGYSYKVNEKSDVYSFGVVLMELVTGKQPIEPEFGEKDDIVNWVSSQLKTRETILGLVDSRIPETMRDDAVKVLRIAILCTAALPAQRPTMRSVVHMLEDADPCKLVRIIIEKDGSGKAASLGS